MLILKKFGIPDWLVSLINRLHTDVKVKLKVGEADVGSCQIEDEWVKPLLIMLEPSSTIPVGCSGLG